MNARNPNNKQGISSARSEHDMEIARRARLTASLRELRLKRDAEAALVEPPVKPAKRAAKPKVTAR